MLKLKTHKGVSAFSKREVINKNLRADALFRLRDDLEITAEVKVRINGLKYAQ